MTTPDPQERAIRLRTGLVVRSPGDRGYQDWADIRHLLHVIDELRAATPHHDTPEERPDAA